MSAAPLVGVLPGRDLPADRYAGVAPRAGWRCVSLAEPSDCEPSLTVAIAPLREAAALARRLSITTGLVAAGGGQGALGIDDLLPAGADDEALLALLARWEPRSPSIATRRQVELFGREAMMPLLASFAERLAALLVASPAAARDGAHQVAGLAGLLGFADVAFAWEALSADGESHRMPARRSARLALATLGRPDLFDGNG